MVIIGGALSLVSKYLLPSIKKVVEERALENIRRHAFISESDFGPDPSLMGAVAMVIQAIFSNLSAVGAVHKSPGGDDKGQMHLVKHAPEFNHPVRKKKEVNWGKDR